MTHEIDEVQKPKANAFQKAAYEQGELWKDNCLKGLQYAGLTIVDEKVYLGNVGVEVDIVARNRHGVLFFCECKGSMRGSRPGCIRTDTLKKAIANGYLFTLAPEYQTSPPLLLLTSHIPLGGAGRAMLYSIERNIFFDVLNPWQHSARLRWMADADPEEIEIDMGTPLIELLSGQWCV